MESKPEEPTLPENEPVARQGNAQGSSSSSSTRRIEAPQPNNNTSSCLESPTELSRRPGAFRVGGESDDDDDDDDIVTDDGSWNTETPITAELVVQDDLLVERLARATLSRQEAIQDLQERNEELAQAKENIRQRKRVLLLVGGVVGFLLLAGGIAVGVVIGMNGNQFVSNELATSPTAAPTGMPNEMTSITTRSFTDDLGVTHVFAVDQPKIIVHASGARSFRHFGTRLFV